MGYASVGLTRHYCENRNCTWFRDVVTHRAAQELKFEHMLYGIVSYKEAAERDILTHHCRAHAKSVAILRRMYGDKKKVVESVAA